MAKQGMKRPDRTHAKPRNTVPPVPELQGKAKTGKAKANPTLDTDLARDNLTNDIPAADRNDL